MSKKVLAALLAVCMVAGLLFVPAAAASTFTDVGEDHWASGAIERWAGYGVLNGKDAEAGIFDPSAPMTRAEFAKMLVTMLGLTAKSDAAFDDVDADAWYAEVVSIAVKAGIITGRGNNKFEPNEPVSFEEAVVMMCRAFGLAKTTEGTDWSKESIEKLTSLGMIGEGADEHLQVGADCDRAVVAALASAVVAEYVDEDRAEPITGEVPGVVLVVKGAKAEIKDATLAAPVVAESAQVTLTNTKADAVIVSGKDAAVTADEASTVASVTLAGEAPKADIKGEVASVTIAEETTGAVVEAPKAENVENNSTESATVNGEAVEGKPVEPTDPTDPDDGKYNGSVSGGGDVPATPACQHEWDAGTQTVAPTCAAEGVKTFVCSKCKETKTEAIEKVAHTFGTAQMVDATNHKFVCSVCGEEKTEAHDNSANPATKCSKCSYKVTITGETPAGHTHVWETTATGTGTAAATCENEGKNVFKCTAELSDGSACSATKEEVVPKLAHTFGEWTVKTAGSCTTYAVMHRTCETCSTEETKNGALDTTKHTEVELPAKAATCSATGLEAGKQCSACKVVTVKQKVVPINANAHDWNEWNAETGTRTCKLNERHVETCDHAAGYENGVCKTCGKAEPTTPPDEHEHSWAEEWTTNSTHHWHECENDDCDVTEDSGKDGYGGHSAGNWEDAATGTNRVKKCTQCEYVMETCTHSGDGITISAEGVCSKCSKSGLTPPVQTPDE